MIKRDVAKKIRRKRFVTVQFYNKKHREEAFKGVSNVENKITLRVILSRALVLCGEESLR